MPILPLRARQPEGDVAPHVQVREEHGVLEDEPDAAAVGRCLRDVLPADHDAAPRRGEQAGDDA